MKVADSLVASVTEMKGYEPGTVLVCYPFGGSLWADTQISCGTPPELIERAAKTAGKKIEAKPVKRLDWS